MGLDMYAYSTKTPVEAVVDFTHPGDTENIHYWRKHPNLHGWMERLYREKDGADEQFNCKSVVLTTEDLDRLEEDINAGTLPGISGFFFGRSDGSEKEGDLEFIAKARAAIAEGKTVFYDSWW